MLVLGLISGRVLGMLCSIPGNNAFSCSTQHWILWNYCYKMVNGASAYRIIILNSKEEQTHDNFLGPIAVDCAQGKGVRHPNIPEYLYTSLSNTFLAVHFIKQPTP